MGRVTFEGPLKSNQGFELGQPGSRSSVAGISVINSKGALNISAASLQSLTVGGTANITACVISGNVDVTSITSDSIQLSPSGTTQSIKIAGAVTGWGNAMQEVDASVGAVSANASLGSVFKFNCGNSATGMTITPVGGYYGQITTWVITAASTTGLTFASSASVQMRMTTGLTGQVIAAASISTIHWLNIGSNYGAAPTTSACMLQIAANVVDHASII